MKTNQSPLKQAIDAMANNPQVTPLPLLNGIKNRINIERLNPQPSFGLGGASCSISEHKTSTAQALRIQHQTTVQAATDTLIAYLNTCTTNQLESIVEAHSEVLVDFKYNEGTYFLNGISKTNISFEFHFADVVYSFSQESKIASQLTFEQTCDLIQTIESVL